MTDTFPPVSYRGRNTHNFLLLLLPLPLLCYPLPLPPPPDIITLSGRCYTGEWADADALPRFPISSSFTPTNPAGAVVRSLAPSCFLPADLIMFLLPSFLLLLRFHPLLQIISAHMTVTSGVRVETRDLTPAASPLHISPSSLTHAHEGEERGRRKLSHNWTTADAIPSL